MPFNVCRLSISSPTSPRYYFAASQIRWIIGACWAWRQPLWLWPHGKSQHHWGMGMPSNRPSVLDSSSSTGPESPSSSSVNSPAAASQETEAVPSSRYVLPKDLHAAIKHLDDQQLDRLVAVALEERARRKQPPVPSQRQRNADAGSPSLPQGKLNAVRAAFKAGVTPARIAREFGISRSDVQRTLAGDAKK
jgi:hypothetical protein